MKKAITILTCALLTIIMIFGCSNADDGSISINNDQINTDNDSITSTDTEIPPPMVDFVSIGKLHDYLISNMANLNEAFLPLLSIKATDGANVQTSSSNPYYYAPSWLPDYEFTLYDATIGPGAVGYNYRPEDYDYTLEWGETGDEYILNNHIDFIWFYGDYDADASLSYETLRSGKIPADGVEGLYYNDYGSLSAPDIALHREYYWVQDGYMFCLRMPLRTIDGMDGRIDEATANQLIMNSALRVELVPDEFFEPPVSIELDENEAELEIGDSITLTADVTPYDSTIDAVMWSSSDNRAAKADQNGVVTRVGEGSATITARTVAGELTATFELTGVPMDYAVTELSVNEIMHDESKDIEVTATFQNNISEAGYVPVELLYAGVVYLSDNIYFDGTPGEIITKIYLIENLFLVDREQILVRINEPNKHAEENPGDNSMVMPPMYVPVPHNDIAIIFMRAYQEGGFLNVEVAYQSRSYDYVSVPVEIFYDGAIIHAGEVKFEGVPFAVILEKYTGPIGDPFPEKFLEVSINWQNRQSEADPYNNVMFMYIDVE